MDGDAPQRKQEVLRSDLRAERKLCVNLKCDPFEANFLRQAFEDVIPGWHMNKTHWNTVKLGGDVPEEELKRQIGKSYDLIKPKMRKNQYDSSHSEKQSDGSKGR